MDFPSPLYLKLENMKLIIGLGNPGSKYKNTRHNIGFEIIDDFYLQNKKQGFSNWEKNKKFFAEISAGSIKDEKIILAKPLSFMNDSGKAVQALMHFYKNPPLDLIVIHDDIDLALGKFKLQKDRSSAGHNGIKSIIEKIGTQNFYRIRIGIAKADRDKQGRTEKFVLNRFNLFEKLKLKKIKPEILQALLDLI